MLEITPYSNQVHKPQVKIQVNLEMAQCQVPMGAGVLMLLVKMEVLAPVVMQILKNRQIQVDTTQTINN
jgi:hypothetical protein